MLPNSRLRHAVLLSAATMIVGGGLTLRAVAPTAPTNLTQSTSGLSTMLTWSPSANSPTQYIVQVGFSPGTTALTFNVSGATPTLSGSGAPGTYYVRVVAVNGDGTSGPSNEITVTLTAGCSPPSPPRNLRAIIRGAEAFIFWIPPAAGSPTGYSLQVGGGPGQTFAQYPTAATTLNGTVGAGSFSARVIANSPCGASAASNEISLLFPGNTVRVADPDPGTSLGMPDIAALVNRIHNENPGLVNQSCPNGRKYENNPWQDRIVDRLRTYDTRFAYNAKPTRTPADNNGFPVIAAGDEITFYAGAGPAQGSGNVYAFDILFDHCGVAPAQNVFRNIAPEPAVWTGANRFVG